MKIHEFDPLIYPRKLWFSVSPDTFSDRFEVVSGMLLLMSLWTVFVISCEICVVFLSDLKVRIPLQ